MQKDELLSSGEDKKIDNSTPLLQKEPACSQTANTHSKPMNQNRTCSSQMYGRMIMQE